LCNKHKQTLPGKSRKHNKSQATWLIHSCEEVNCNITIKYDEQGQFVTNNLARAVSLTGMT